MREVAEHARQQEALREAAEREKQRALRQVEELQKQLLDAKAGHAAAFQSQVLQTRLGAEASGEDELNAFRMLRSKPAKPLLVSESGTWCIAPTA